MNAKLLPPGLVLWPQSQILHIKLGFERGFECGVRRVLHPWLQNNRARQKAEGACSHLSSPFSSSDLSNLPDLITPAVSLGTTEGCCGSEMLVRNTLIVWCCLASECRSNSQARRDSFHSFYFFFFFFSFYFFSLFDIAS